MSFQIEKTRLWAISLGSKDADQEIERKKERLRSTLRRFREHTSVLTSRIAATFPQLTIHDVTHLDALWETAACGAVTIEDGLSASLEPADASRRPFALPDWRAMCAA